MIMQKIKDNNRFIMAVILIICASIISIIWQKSILLGSNVGYIDLFIYGNTYGNIIMDVFAPLFAVLTVETEGHGKGIKNIIYKPFKAGIKSGLTFVVGLIILLIILFLYNTSPPKVQLGTPGAFSVILYNSKILYIVTFIAHSFLYGFVFAVFGYGLALNTKNKMMVYFIPILINQLSLFTPYLFPSSMLKEVLFFTPQLPYDVLTNQNTILGNIKDLGLIIIAGAILIFTYHIKVSRKKGNQCIERDRA